MAPTSSRGGRYIGSIDQGTSSTRFILFEAATGKAAYSHQVELTQINYPDAARSGWAEHSPDEILQTTLTCIAETLKKANASAEDLAAIGITNQRETTVVWDVETGKPLHNALVWHDTRTVDIVNRFTDRNGGNKDFLRPVCGLPISTYFSAVKLIWLQENVPAVRQAIDAKRAKFGTVDSWLLWNLTGGVNGGHHVTDVSNASRTMLMDITKRQWSAQACDMLNIDPSVLPEIKSNAEVYGIVKSGPAAGVPLAGCLGDQQAALLGQLCVKPGEAKNTYGTGCFMLLNTGTKAVPSRQGLLTTMAFQLGASAPALYALEGAIPVAGSAIQWLRDKLQLIKSAPEVNDLALEVKDNGGCYFVTAFSGLLSPYWRTDARGVIAGLSHSTQRGHIARATIEAAAWQTRDVADAMVFDSGVPFQQLKVDGGMAMSDVLAQFQADVMQVPVVRPESLEATAAGAAYAAGLAVGAWPSLDALIKIVGPSQKPRVFQPQANATDIARQFHMWHRAVSLTFGWTERVPGEDPLPAQQAQANVKPQRRLSLEDEARRGLHLASSGKLEKGDLDAEEKKQGESATA